MYINWNFKILKSWARNITAIFTSNVHNIFHQNVVTNKRRVVTKTHGIHYL